ncbi:MAG: MutS-related protein, partial [Streptosporangiaceae bacterium]
VMKAFLMYRDRDFDVGRELPRNEGALTQDLELDTLLRAMGADDDLVFDVSKRALLSSLRSPEEIVYRQNVLRDCLRQPSVVREIYEVAVAAIQEERRVYRGLFSDRPDAILSRSIQVLQLFVEKLKRLRYIADQHADEFRSEGFSRFFEMLAKELDDAYFDVVEEYLRQLRFRKGALVSARLGRGNKGIDYVLRKPSAKKPRLVDRIAITNRSSYTLTIPDRDENGARALAELRERGINLVANALAQSTDHILSFFGMVRCELGFYVGCLNLHKALTRKGEPACFPVPREWGMPVLRARGLYDPCLALTLERRVTGNDLTADGKRLVMITGANQGGKSTFLRSLGLAQLMTQSGMFVSAEAFSADVRGGVFTHYKREEDATMTSGKLDEELSRMSEIADTATSSSLLLCNESFASTNEREGSEIARQVVRALLDSGVKVFFVTHLFDLAQRFHRQRRDDAVFLRAERQAGGRRTFRLVEGEPLPTSYGEDLYERIFGTPAGSTPSRT